jgi:acyl-CoA synthetase (AMP-forming)/AMP-acid ligase II
MLIGGSSVDGRPERPNFTPFWQTLADHADAPAIVDPSRQRSWTYQALADDVASGAIQLAGKEKGLILICADNGAGFVLVYLSALRAGHAVMLVPSGKDRVGLIGLAEAYNPDAILVSGPVPPKLLSHYVSVRDIFGLRHLIRAGEIDSPSLHPELALVLPTSGTSGRPKMVRLSASNIVANAHQIRLGLSISSASRAATLLPLSYVFGLSVLHSHLAAGASLMLSGDSVVDPDFWRSVREHQVTTIAGVSITFDILRRLRFDRRTAPSLGQFLHSGGRLSQDTLAWIRQELACDADVRLMYGMTEAAGRVCMPASGLISVKPESVGRPAPWGEIKFSPESEIIYSGPNVMLGYAETRSDLARGDDLQGVLHTGDLGFTDADGDIFITGRTSRILKIFGRRHSLDDLEERFSSISVVAAVRQDQTIAIFHSEGDKTLLQETLLELAQDLGIPANIIHLASISEIPRNAVGKIAYDRLPRVSAGDGRQRGWGILD